MIKKGSIVTCPNCKKHLMKTAEDIFTGTQVVVELFEMIGEFKLKVGDRSICNHCSAYYFVHGQLHTESGWQT